MVNWLKKISICLFFVCASVVFLVACDKYDRLALSLSHIGGIEDRVEMTFVEGVPATYEITARVTGVKKGVSDRVRYEVQNGNNLTVTSDYKGDGETVLTLTASKHGTSTLTISTVEGNKSKSVTVVVYKKVESVAFSSDNLAIKSGGTLNLNNYIKYTPADTNQVDMNYELVRVETDNGNTFGYSENYASIQNGVLRVADNATLPTDPVSGLPYVTVKGISAFDNTIETEVINIVVVEQVEVDDINVISNSNNGNVTLVKNYNGEYHVVLASNIGFTNVDGADSVLFRRRLYFQIGDDPDVEAKYTVSVDQKYLESYQNNQNLTDQEIAELMQIPILITKLQSNNLGHETFDIQQRQIGNIVVPFVVSYSEYEGLPDIIINVRLEVLAFPTSINAISNGQEIQEGNPLKVLNLYSNNLTGTPLTISTNNDNVATRLYFKFEVDKGTAPTNGVVVTTSNPNNVYEPDTNILTGTTVYLHHTYNSDSLESINNAYLVVTYVYDLNPASIGGVGDEAEIGNFSYSIEKKIPLTFRAGIDAIPLESKEVKVDATSSAEVLLLSTTMGVYANEFTYTCNTTLFTLRVTDYACYIVPNKDGLSGEVSLVIQDPIRRLYDVCRIIVYVPFAYTENNTIHLEIENENSYQNEILASEYEETSVTLTTESGVELTRSYSMLKKLTLQVNSEIPINAFNYILDPQLDNSLIDPEGDLEQASQNYIKVVNINHYIRSCDIPIRYGRFVDGVLRVNSNTYTNIEEPLIVTFTFVSYDKEGTQVTLTHSIELLIYTLVNNLNVTVSNTNIYEYNSVGALNQDLATSIIKVNNSINNAATISFYVEDYVVKTFRTAFGDVSFNVTDLFTITQVEGTNIITLVSKVPGSVDEEGSGLYKLNLLLSEYGTVNNVLADIYATKFEVDIVVTLTQFGRSLSSLVQIGTNYAIKSERIILNNVNSASGLYFDKRDLVTGYYKEIGFTVEPSNAFNKKVRLIYNANDVFSAELNTAGNIVRIYPRLAGEQTLRLAFEDSYEEVETEGSVALVPTKYIDIRIKVADGSILYPFEIADVDDFEGMLNDINTGNNSYNYVLSNSINLSNVKYVTPKNVFNGSLNGLFEYTLDGIDYKLQYDIIGLTINVDDDILNNGTTNIGMFGELSANATIKNLNLTDAKINVVQSDITLLDTLNIGVFAGTNRGNIENSRVVGNIAVTVMANTLNVGGFVGHNYGLINGLPSINNGMGDTDINSVITIQVDRTVSYTTTDTQKVTGYMSVGGLAGQNEGVYRNSTANDQADIYDVKVVANITTTNNDVTNVDEVETIANNDYSLLTAVGGVLGQAKSTKVKDVVVRANKILGTNNVGGILGIGEDSYIDNSIVQFVNRGLNGITASNIIGYTNVGGLIGQSIGDSLVKYSYVRSFYNKTINDIDNSSYYGNIVTLSNYDEVEDAFVNVGGLIGATIDKLVEDVNLALTIEKSYVVADINTSANSTINTKDKTKYRVGGLVGLSTVNTKITNAYVLANIKMPEGTKTTKRVTITDLSEITSEAGGSTEGEDEPGAPATIADIEPEPGYEFKDIEEDIEVPSFGYFTGNTIDIDGTLNPIGIVSTMYSVINNDVVNDTGFYSFFPERSKLNDSVKMITSEDVLEVEEVIDDETGETYNVKYLMKSYDLLDSIRDSNNGFKLTFDYDYNLNPDNNNGEPDWKMDWYLNYSLNEGFPVLFDENDEVMYSILPSSIMAIIAEEDVEFTNNSHFKVDENKVILFHNRLTSGVEYTTNNIYKIVLEDNEFESGVNYNNVITVSLGIDTGLQGIAKVESSITVTSSNVSVLSIENGNTIRTVSAGCADILIASTLDPTINTQVQVLVVEGFSDFNLYSGSVANENVVTTKQQLIIDKVYRYNANAINTYYFNGINGVYARNENLGYIITSGDYNTGTIGTDTNSNAELKPTNSYLYQSLGNFNLVGFTSGEITLTLTPVLFTGDPSFGDTIYIDNQNRIVTLEQIELEGIEDYTTITGAVTIEQLSKEYLFDVIERADSLSLNNTVGSTILPTGTSEVNVTIVTSAFTMVGDQAQITEGLNVLIYKSNTEVGLLNLTYTDTQVEYEENRYKESYNDTLISFNDISYTYSLIEGENKLRVNYKFNLTFDQEKYLNNADEYSMNGLDYELVFYPTTNISLKELSTSRYSFSIKPQEIDQIQTSFYPSGQATVTDEFNPLENSTEYIAPSRYGLLVINVFPKFNNADYYEVTVPTAYRQNITLEQMYAMYDNASDSSVLRGYQRANPTALQLSNFMGIRLYNISNNFGRFDGNLYVRILVTSSIPVGAVLNFTITPYQNGQDAPVADSAICTLRVSPLPGITANIDGMTSDILLAKTFTKVGTITATEFSGEIAWEIRTSKGRGSDYELELTDTGFTITALSSAVGGDSVEIIFSVYQIINGVREESDCRLYLTIVEYEVLGFSVQDAALNDNGENQLDILNGVTKLLNVNVSANINTADSNVMATKTYFSKLIAGQGYAVPDEGAQILAPNNWYTRSAYSASSYNDVSLSVNFGGELVRTQYNFIFNLDNNNIPSYFIKATRISDINIFVLRASYYYDSNGIARPVYAGLDTSGLLVYEKEFVFRLNIKDNSTYDHPNPVYTYDDIVNMQEGSHYILMNDLLLDNFVPFKVQGFASFDGNNYRIQIRKFDLSSYKGGAAAGTVNIGLFETISSTSIVKNLVLDISNLLISNSYVTSLNQSSDSEYIAGYNLVNASDITSLNFGLIAGTNSGTITNCKIINSSNTQANYLYVYTTQSKINGNTPTANIGGMVGVNNGVITNSFIGVNAVNTSNKQIYIGAGSSSSDIITTYPFRIAGSNSIAGVAYSNSNKIVSTYANAVGVTNTNMTADDNNITAGFVGLNSGLLSNVFVQGDMSNTRFRADEYYRIESKGKMGGLVHTNSGEIRDAFANIAIQTNSGRSGGFVFRNESGGTITNAYSTAKNSVNSRAHGAFIGTNEIGEVQNSASPDALQSIYYLVVGDELINEEEVATPIKSKSSTEKDSDSDGQEVGTSTSDPFTYAGSFNGFSFGLGSDTNSVWTYTNNDLGPQLISCVVNDTYSNRYLSSTDESIDSGDGTTVVYTYNYDYNGQVGGKQTSYGQVNNPLIVRSGQEFVDFIINNSNASRVFGGNDVTVSHVRLINDIDLSGINLNEYKVDNKLLSEIIFNGTLDGNCLNITGISLLDSTRGTPKDDYGLFKQVGLESNGDLYTAIIKNVSLDVSQLVATNVKLVGTVAGRTINAKYVNVHVSSSNDTTIQGRDIVGGLTGLITGYSSLIDVSCSVSISSVYRTQLTTTDVLPYFEYPFSGYNGTYSQSQSYGYAGGIAGIIDANNTPIDYSQTKNIEDIFINENNDYRTSEPTSPNIKNLRVYGGVIISGEHAGGLFGYVGKNTHIYDSLFELDDEEIQEIDGLYYSGGIVGENHGFLEKVRIEYAKEVQDGFDATIVTTGEVVGNRYLFRAANPIAIGGIAGFNQDAIIIDSYSKVNVYTTTGYVAGGVIGINKGYALLQHVYATGLVYSAYVMGGIFGYVNVSKYILQSDGTRNYPIASNNSQGETTSYTFGGVRAEANGSEKIVLDYVVALNTWNSETNTIITDNMRGAFANSIDGTYYTFTPVMPEIGNQMVDKMYKINEFTNEDMSVSFRDEVAGQNTKELDSVTSYYTYRYTKNIGSIVGRVSCIGQSVNSEDISFEIKGKYGTNAAVMYPQGNSKDFDLGIVDIFYTSNSNDEVNNVEGYKASSRKSIKDLSQSDVTIYSTTYSNNDVSNVDISKDVPSSSEYNRYTYYNYLGWQRDVDYLIGNQIEVDERGSDSPDSKNLVQDNVFRAWISITASSDEKVFKINEDTGLPEYIIGIYSNLIEITNITDWNDNIRNAATKNKYFSITSNLDLTSNEAVENAFEGTIIGQSGSGNSRPKITFNVAEGSLNSLFSNISRASISNVDFEITYKNTDGLIVQDSSESVGVFADDMTNSVLTDVNITVNMADDSVGKDDPSTNVSISNAYTKNFGLVFGKVTNSNFVNNIEDPFIAIKNVSKRRFTFSNGTSEFNFGLFVGYIQNTTFNNLVFETGSADINVVYSRNQVNTLNFGGLIGYSNKTSYPTIAFRNNVGNSVGDIINIDFTRGDGSSTNNTSTYLKIGGLVGSLNSATMTNISHNGIINVGSETSHIAKTTNLYAGGVVGYGQDITLNNVSNNVVFDPTSNNQKVVTRKDEKIAVQAAATTNNVYVGGLVGRISGSTITGTTGSSSGSLAESANNAIIEVTTRNATNSAQTYVGGIVGFSEGTSNNYISQVYNSGNITVTTNGTSNLNYVGGIVGNAISIEIARTYNIGDITIKESSRFAVGGLIGAVSPTRGSSATTINYNITYGNITVPNSPNDMRVGGIVGKGVATSNVTIAISDCVSMTRTYGNNNNTGLIQGIGYGVGTITNSFYISEFAPATITSSNLGTALTYASFDQNSLRTVVGTQSDYAFKFTDYKYPILKNMYDIKDIDTGLTDMSEGTKFNPKKISSGTTNLQNNSNDYVIITSQTCTVTSGISSTDFKGLIASANNTTINYRANTSFLSGGSNDGILSGIKLNVTSNTNNLSSYLVQDNGTSGLIFNCGIEGVVENRYLQAPVALQNAGRIINTGVAFINTTTSYNNQVSGFVGSNTGVIFQSYSTMQSPNVNAPNSDQYNGLLYVNGSNYGDIQQSYFAGWYNNYSVSEASSISSNQNIYYEEHVAGSKTKTSSEFFGGKNVFSSSVWNVQGANKVNSINFGYPTLKFDGSLTLYTTYTNTDLNYSPDSNGGYLVVSHNGMFANMAQSAGSKIYLLISNITINTNTTYTLEFSSNFNGNGKTVTLSNGKSMFSTIKGNANNSITIQNFTVTATQTVASAIASKSITDANVSNITFGKITSSKGLIAPEFNAVSNSSVTLSNISFNTTEITITNTAQGAIVDKVAGSTSHRVTIQYINSSNSRAITISSGDKVDDRGGLFGIVQYADLTQCCNNSSIVGRNHVGGIVGSASNSTFSSCYNNANVEGKQQYVGGILGFSDAGTITITGSQSGSYATITGTDNVGGIAGYVDRLTFNSNSNNYSAIKGNNILGGIVGRVNTLLTVNSGVTVTNNSSGKVTSNQKDPNYIGGIAGNISSASISGSLTNNASVEITLTSSDDFNTVRGDQFTYSFDDKEGENPWSAVTSGSNEMWRGVTTKSTITDTEHHVNLIFGRSGTVYSRGTVGSSARIIVNKNCVHYYIGFGTGTFHKGMFYWNRVERQTRIIAYKYTQFTYNNSSTQFQASVSAGTVSSDYINIDTGTSLGRGAAATCRAWTSLFGKTTFYLNITW